MFVASYTKAGKAEIAEKKMKKHGIPPIIIIGMSRSGTSIITKMLNECGLFIGNDLRGGNSEAYFFFRLNEWFLSIAKASWDNPYTFNFIDSNLISEAIRVAEYHLKGFGRWQYLGYEYFFKYKSIRDIDFPWGWKDPRNTVTLKIWGKIFPDCKIIHITRNPVDVAESLRVGRIRHLERERRTWKWTVKEYLLKHVEYQLSARTAFIEEGYKLWREYINMATGYEEKYEDRIIRVKYEEFIDHTGDVLKRICNFIGLECDDRTISGLTGKIDKNRKYAFLKQESLVNFYQTIRNDSTVAKVGYDAIC